MLPGQQWRNVEKAQMEKIHEVMRTQQRRNKWCERWATIVAMVYGTRVVNLSKISYSLHFDYARLDEPTTDSSRNI